jgi:hypothetical protein
MDNTVGSQLENIIVGTLLGDGCLERNGRYTRLIIDHSMKQAKYVEWLSNELRTLPHSLIKKKRLDSRTMKTYEHYILRTHTSCELEKYFDMFYPQKVKRIPEHLRTIINPQILAIWIMDDGYKRNDCNAMRLNTQSYTYDDHEVIRESLKSFDIDSHIQKHKAGFVLYIPSHSMNTLRNLVRPYIIESMEYKIA